MTPVDPGLLQQLRQELALRMTESVGILRNAGELQRALDEFLDLRQRYRMILARWAGRPLRGMLRTCTLTARAALHRRETRGAHIREDFPAEDAQFAGHLTLRRGHPPRIVTWT
jgi:succinate dehydrogenase/fumarate reductase flavoprotein subunit